MNKEEMEKKRDELAEDCAMFCHCNGYTCSGCEESTKKLIKTGWDACAKEYEKLNGDAVRLWNENESLKKEIKQLQEKVSRYKKLLEDVAENYRALSLSNDKVSRYKKLLEDMAENYRALRDKL